MATVSTSGGQQRVEIEIQNKQTNEREKSPFTKNVTLAGFTIAIR